MLIPLLCALGLAQEAPAPEAPAPEAAPPAQEASAPGPARRVGSDGELRYLFSLPPDLPLDAEGRTLGQAWVLDQRWRLGGALALGQARLHAEADLFTGQLLGDPWDIPGGLDERHRDSVGVLQPHAFAPRELYAERRLGPVHAQVGLMTSHWGLGLLANDGAHDPLFGRADGGDVVLRAMGTTLPLEGRPLVLAVAADRVWHDDIGSWFPGRQAAWQGVLAAAWAPQDGPTAGAYAVYRHQAEADRVRSTDIVVLDATFDAPAELGPLTVRAAAESALILGRSTRSPSASWPEGLRVRQLGAVGLLSAHLPDQRLGLVLRGGWASGDGDPYDDTTRDFGMDPNLDAGMVLFDEVGGALGAEAYARLDDPQHMGQPPDGADVLVTEGAVRRAAFAQPVLEGRPVDGVLLRVGGLVGWSTAPILDPFLTGRNGGVPTNHLGVETQGYRLGAELDWAVVLEREVQAREVAFTPALLLQGGHAWLSADLGGGRADLLTATARVRW